MECDLCFLTHLAISTYPVTKQFLMGTPFKYWETYLNRLHVYKNKSSGLLPNHYPCYKINSKLKIYCAECVETKI